MANITVPDDSDFEDGAAVLNDDNDDESLIDIQSPADGYFEQRNIPQQTFVENPALQSPKAKEAEEEQIHSNYPQPQPSSQRPQASRWADEATPLLDVEAPPDYESATAGQRQQQQQAFNSEHPLVRNGLLSDRGSVNSRSEPQSMRDPGPAQPPTTQPSTSTVEERDYATLEAQPTEHTHLLRDSSRDHKAKRSRPPNCAKTCVLAIVVIILIIFGIAVTMVSSDSNKSKSDGKNPDTTAPGEKVPTGPTPDHPSELSRNCPFNSFSATESFEFAAPNGDFEFMERIDFHSHAEFLPHGVDISGNVRISPADEEQANGGPDIKVWVNIATFDPITIPNLLVTRDGSFFEIHFPHIETNNWRGEHRACFDVAVAIHVRRGVELKVWKTSATHLNVDVDDQLFASSAGDGLAIKHDSLIHTVSGHIKAKYWNSRRTIIETTSGRIEGSFALRDELTLMSTSGTIEADVDPKRADDTNPLPAEFTMETVSGSMAAVFPTGSNADIPCRDYRTYVKSTSGRIEGSYILGKETKFLSSSSSIEIGILPYSSKSTSLSLITGTHSGRTQVDILEPYHADSMEGASNKHRKGILDSMQSEHTSISGAIKVKYPQNWEGTFTAESLTGDLGFHGKDVHIEFKSDYPPMAQGYKGEETDSTIKFQTTTGQIDAVLGEW